MEENIYITRLFDYYGCLLTDKQCQYFSDYYLENLSLSEIAENYDVSRNAVFKQLKEAENKLKYYEEKLKLSENGIKIEKLLEKINDKRIKEQIEKLI